MNFSSRSCARSVLPLEIYRRNASRSLEKESEIVQEDFQAKKDKTKAKAGVERGKEIKRLHGSLDVQMEKWVQRQAYLMVSGLM